MAVARSSSGGVAIRYVLPVLCMDDVTFAHNGREQAYTTSVLKVTQHGFDTEAHSRADPPRGSIKAGQCLISDISLIKMFISPRFWQMTYRLGEKVDFDGISTSLEQIVNSRCRSRDVM